jgi:hypothetical protein
MEQVSKGGQKMSKFHNVEKLEFEGDVMVVKVDGNQYRLPLSKISTRLANASKLEREQFEISSSGYGVHWPIIDEDLSIDGLLGITHTPRKIKEKAGV